MRCADSRAPGHHQRRATNTHLRPGTMHWALIQRTAVPVLFNGRQQRRRLTLLLVSRSASASAASATCPVPLSARSVPQCRQQQGGEPVVHGVAGRGAKYGGVGWFWRTRAVNAGSGDFREEQHCHVHLGVPIGKEAYNHRRVGDGAGALDAVAGHAALRGAPQPQGCTIISHSPSATCACAAAGAPWTRTCSPLVAQGPLLGLHP